MDGKQIKPIGIIHTDYKEKFGIPRQSGRVSSALGIIELYPPFNDPMALRAIDEFSHLWLIFDFSDCEYNRFSPTVRPPRLGGNTRVGVFATRSPYRPNGLGLSVVKFNGIDKNGNIIVSGVDMLDKTPIYDIKPYIPYADIKTDAVDGFTQNSKNHRLKISGGAELLNALPKDKAKTAIDSICDDPRPSYQEDIKRVYSMRFAEYDIHFTVDGDNVNIVRVDKL